MAAEVKDWRGVISVLFIAGMVLVLAVLEPALRLPTGMALMTLLGAVAQRSKLDALVSNMLATGTTLSPPPNGGRSIAVPPMPPPPLIIEPGTSLRPPQNGDKGG